MKNYKSDDGMKKIQELIKEKGENFLSYVGGGVSTPRVHMPSNQPSYEQLLQENESQKVKINGLNKKIRKLKRKVSAQSAKISDLKSARTKPIVNKKELIEISSKDILLKEQLESIPGGRICNAVWESTGVIVKIVTLLEKLEEGQKRDVLRDLEINTRVQNPRIVRNFGVSFQGKEVWIVFERMECDLFKYIKKTKYSIKKKIDFMINMSRAVKIIHQYRIVHRDIKCENFLVSPTGFIKISDFGEARIMPIAKGQYKTKAAGSIQWMATEVAKQGAKKAICTSESDIYSLGCAFYEILFEKPPFYQVDLFELLDLKRSNAHPDLSNPPEGSKDLINVIKLCWRLNPKKRPTAIDLVDILMKLRHQ